MACCTPRRSNLASLAQAVGTPFYCYSTATLERHYRVFAGAFADVPSLVCYAVKANSNQAVLATLAKLGAGADVVSGGELKRALAAGMPPDKIMFSGIGKTAAELGSRSTRTSCASTSSPSRSSSCSPPSPPARGAPRHLDPRQSRRRCETHAKIATGKRREQVRHPDQPCARRSMPSAAKLPGLRVVGVDMHIGSQITDLAPFDDAFALLSDFVRELRADGQTIAHVDLGGGLGIPYRATTSRRPTPPPMPTWSSARRAASAAS